MHFKSIIISLLFIPTLLSSSDPREPFFPIKMRTGSSGTSVKDILEQRERLYLDRIRAGLDLELRGVDYNELKASLYGGELDYHMLASQYLQRKGGNRKSNLEKAITCLERAQKEVKKKFISEPHFYSALLLADTSATTAYRLMLFDQPRALEMLKQGGHYCFIAAQYLNERKETILKEREALSVQAADFILKLLFAINSSETRYFHNINSSNKVALSSLTNEIARRIDGFAPEIYDTLKSNIASIIRVALTLKEKEKEFNFEKAIEILQPSLQKINGIMVLGTLTEYIANYYSFPENFAEELDEKVVLEDFLTSNPEFSRGVAAHIIKLVHPHVRDFMAEYREIKEPTLISYLPQNNSQLQTLDTEIDEISRLGRLYVESGRKIDERYRLPVELYGKIAEESEVGEEFLKQGTRLASIVLKDMTSITEDMENLYFAQLEQMLAGHEVKLVSIYLLYQMCKLKMPENERVQQKKRSIVFAKMDNIITSDPGLYQEMKRAIIRDWGL